MFSFTTDKLPIIEQNAKHGDIIEKYPNSYIITTNGHVEDEEICGDIVSILTKEEYAKLDKPKNLAPKFSIWIGSALLVDEVNNRIGFVI